MNIQIHSSGLFVLVPLELVTRMVSLGGWVELCSAAPLTQHLSVFLCSSRFVELPLFLGHLLNVLVEDVHIEVISISEVLVAVPALLDLLS